MKIRVAIALLVGLGTVGTVGLRAGIAEGGEVKPAPYDRTLWRHWVDQDHDCQDTRNEVLIAESLEPVEYADDRGCKVAKGKWLCPYTGKVITDPGLLDVDHMVPLRNAHNSGGLLWSESQRRAYANDLSVPEHLVAVDRGSNRAKGARGPEEWLPESPDHRCEYVSNWVEIKSRWRLGQTLVELAAIETALGSCRRGGVPERP